MNPEPAPVTPAEPRGLVVKVLGIGGAGGNALEPLMAAGLDAGGFIALNTDARELARCAAPLKLQLGAKAARGLGTSGDPERGRAAAEPLLPRVRELVNGADVVFLAAGLGGGTGTGASPVIAAAARETGALVIAVVTLPFECEGPDRLRRARQGLERLQSAADGVLCLPNEAAQKLFDEHTTVVEMFQATNALLAEGIAGLWRMLTRPGLIHVDVSVLSSVLRRRHSECRFASATAAGPDRAREALDRLFASPLLEGGELLTNADALLVSLIGGPGLTMAEINRVMDRINRQCDGVHLVLGAAVDAAFGEKLSITVIASRAAGDVDGALPPGIAASKSPGADEGFAFLNPASTARPATRVVAPAPEATAANIERLQPAPPGSKARRRNAKATQGVLPLEIVSKGRFEKSEPTLRNGEDLDYPTFVRKGIALN